MIKSVSSRKTFLIFKSLLHKNGKAQNMPDRLVSHPLNKAWSIALADLQQLKHNSGIRIFFVAVETLSRFLWVMRIKSCSSKAGADARRKICEDNKENIAPKICASRQLWPEKICSDRRKARGSFAKLSTVMHLNLIYKQRNKNDRCREIHRNLKIHIFKVHEHYTNQ